MAIPTRASNPAPTVTSITPNTGTAAGGTSVTITGTGFLAGATVSLGGTAATNVNVVSSTSITATTPAHASGAVSVVVTNTDTQSGTLNNGYTYTASNPAPTITSIAPNTGTAAGGTAVTISGTGFLAGATVSLGGNSGYGRDCRERHVDHGNDTGTRIGCGECSRDEHRYAERHIEQWLHLHGEQPGADRHFDHAQHRYVNGGTAVTITGTGFLAGATVSLGGTCGDLRDCREQHSITATTPAHAAGAVSVVVTNTDAQSGSLNNGYTYTASNPAPTVTSIAPNTGTTAGGTSVTITGTGFLAGATVSLGGTAATNVTVS